ncbi:MAG: M23 family metallopeptidase [Acidimicrobiia bacterium]|nr:M23 family metallopeptidase [Acidimicrobiia bacterium]
MHRLLSLLAVVLVALAVTPTARAHEGHEPPAPPDVLDALTGRLHHRVGEGFDLDRERLPDEAFAARVRGAWPEVATGLAQMRAAAVQTVGPVIGSAVADRLVGRPVTDFFKVPGVAMQLETVEDIAVLEGLTPRWRRAMEAYTAATERFDVGGFRQCPIKGWHWFIDTWGAARPGHRLHSGTDIHSLLGMRLYAMESGRIVQMNWHYAGGRTLYLLGETSGDVYYYAHLDGYARDVGLGDRVELGDFIGYVGDTGNAHGPHLHLGWMPGTGGVDFDALQNPYFLLVDLCG